MGRTTVDLKEIAARAEARHVAARVQGELNDTEAPVWGEGFAASGNGKPTPTPTPTQPQRSDASN